MNDHVKQYMAEIGRKGGKSKSEAKRLAALRNLCHATEKLAKDIGLVEPQKPVIPEPKTLGKPPQVNYGERNYSSAYTSR